MSLIDQCPADLERYDALLLQVQTGENEREAFLELIRLAESLVERFPAEANTHHMLGLAWYHAPFRSAFRSWHCRRALEAAVQLDPCHQYAWQYLAYLAFDQERYADSLAAQGHLHHDYFIGLDQEWRALKNEETKLVCRMRLDAGCFPEEEFTAFEKWYLDAWRRECDGMDGSAVPPQEMRELAEWLFVTGAPVSDRRLRRILSFIVEAGETERIHDLKLRALAAHSWTQP